jgi:D-threonate/D-erythronate kinase
MVYKYRTATAMTPRLAIIADDLTGALDTSTPFALRGLRVAVPLTLKDIGEALAAQPQVIAVNTASRALDADTASRRVAEAGRVLLGAGRPDIVFKKIDSRLKGNIAAETASLAQIFGFGEALVAPAVPDQARFTLDGAVTGRGLDAPIAIAPHFAGLPLDIAIRDARTDGDLDGAVEDYRGRWGRTLAIGARGLGGALARGFAGRGETATDAAIPASAALFALGSTDPITLAQIAELKASAEIIAAPAGALPAPDARRLPLVLQISGDPVEPADIVAARFAEGVADHVAAFNPARLVMGGGDTTLAILKRLGARVLYPVGEAAPGLPAFDIALRGRKTLRCIAKSGGFGAPDVLAGLLLAR